MFARALSALGQHPVSARSWFTRDALAVLAPFLTSRVLIFALIALAPTVFSRGPFWIPGGLLEKLTQWDSVYYLHIARHGYFYSPETVGTVGFFPFFPILVRLMSVIFHDYRLAAIFVSNSCLFVAGCLLHRLVTVDFADRKVADATVTLLMFSPVSFFFSTAYSEAAFIMFAVASFLAAVRGWWFTAGLCGMCLAATRNVGFFMVVPLTLEYVRQNYSAATPVKSLLKWQILALALVPAGLALFMLWCYAARHDAFAYTHASAGWGRRLVSPWRTLHTLATIPLFHRWLFLGALCVGLALSIGGVLVRVRASYLIWAALLIATYVCSNSMEAIPRYLSVVFPLFIVLAIGVTRYRWSYTPILALSVALLTVCTILLANGYWMT